LQIPIPDAFTGTFQREFPALLADQQGLLDFEPPPKCAAHLQVKQDGGERDESNTLVCAVALELLLVSYQQGQDGIAEKYPE
jgi:hypothetical protein